jgi:hypothetical protein
VATWKTREKEVAMKPTLNRAVGRETADVTIARRGEPVWMRWVVLVAAFANVVVNTFAGALFPLTVSQASVAQRPLFIDPANWAFAIWAPLFVGMLGFGLYQAFGPGRRDPRLVGARIPMAVSFVCGAFWPAAIARRDIGMALVLILGMLVSAAAAYPHLRAGHARNATDRVWVRWTVSAYLGWLSVATLISVTGVLANQVGLGPNWLMPDLAWACLGIAVAGSLGVAFALAKRDVAFNVAVGWGLVAIAAEQSLPAITSAVTLSLVAMAIALYMGRSTRLDDRSFRA